MYKMLSYEAVRRAVFVEGLSRSQAAKRFGKDPRTIKKMGVDKLSPKRPIWGLGGRERHLKSQVIFDMTSTDPDRKALNLSTPRFRIVEGPVVVVSRLPPYVT